MTRPTAVATLFALLLCACSDNGSFSPDSILPADSGTVTDGPVVADSGVVTDGPATDTQVADGPSTDDAAADASLADGPLADGPLADGQTGDTALADGPLADAQTTDTTTADGPLADAQTADAAIADGLTADGPACGQVVLSFEGTVATVVGTPVGLTGAAKNAAATGELAYLLCIPDSNAADPLRAEYDHDGGGFFTLTVDTASIVGSNKPIVTVQNLSSDTFRWEDGNIPIDPKTRTMTLNGQPAPSLRVWIAITDGSGNAWTTDAAPAIFPFTNITAYPHTFSIQDGNGTLLLQLSSITQL